MPPPPWQPIRVRSSRRGWRVALALVAMVGLGTAGVLAWPYLNDEPRPQAQPVVIATADHFDDSVPYTEEEAEPVIQENEPPVEEEVVVIPKFPAPRMPSPPPGPVPPLPEVEIPMAVPPPLPGVRPPSIPELPSIEEEPAPPPPPIAEVEAPSIPELPQVEEMPAPPPIPVPVPEITEKMEEPIAPPPVPQLAQPEKSPQPLEGPPPLPSDLNLPPDLGSSTVNLQEDKGAEGAPVPSVPPLDTHPSEESPMITQRDRFGFAALIAGAMAIAAPTAADAQDKETVDAFTQQMEKLDGMLRRMSTLEEKLNKDITTNSNQLAGVIIDLKDLDQKVKDLQADMQGLQDELKALREEMKALSVKGTESKASPLAGSTGSIKLVNDYYETVTVLVNGEATDIGPGRQKILSIPSGSFTYQVLEWQSVARTRTLVPNDTFTVRIHPQQ